MTLLGLRWHAARMIEPDPKAELAQYLQAGRDALLWKLEGLSELDARRPLVSSGTNLLGLVKHLSAVEAGYLGETFGRPFGEPLPGLEDGAEPDADMWATAEESREQVVGVYRRVWAHADATVAALDLTAPGRVRWWPPERAEVTLRRVLVHLVAETHRHAGHADVVRELVDGSAGLRAGNDLPGRDAAGWTAHRARVQRAAEEAAGRG